MEVFYFMHMGFIWMDSTSLRLKTFEKNVSMQHVQTIISLNNKV
jgi:hypothetical protein